MPTSIISPGASNSSRSLRLASSVSPRNDSFPPRLSPLQHNPLSQESFVSNTSNTNSQRTSGVSPLTIPRDSTLSISSANKPSFKVGSSSEFFKEEEEDDAVDLSIEERRKAEDQLIMKITGASLQDILEYREIFELVDTDKGGSIDASELRKLVDLMNMESSEDELNEMMDEIDTTGQGEIFFPDFVACMLTKPDIDYTIDDVKAAFATLAGNNYPAGFIPLKLLEEQLMNIGNEHEKISKEKCDEILGLVEVDGHGMHNYGEFVSLMMGSASLNSLENSSEET